MPENQGDLTGKLFNSPGQTPPAAALPKTIEKMIGTAAKTEISHGRTVAFVGLMYLLFKGRTEGNKESR